MPRRNAPRHRQATRQEISKITYLGYELSELFDEEEIADIVSIAKHSVAGEFFHAKEFNPRAGINRKKKLYVNTDNYIIGVANRPGQLARYVAEMTHRQIVHQSQLPSDLRELHQSFVDAIVAQARYNAVLIAINLMKDDGNIWYDEGRGIWCIEETVVESFLEDDDFRRKTKRAVKNDFRPFHGRPNRDRSRGVRLA